MISDKGKFIYIHIPKTAGESVEEALTENFPDSRIVSNDPDWNILIKHDTFLEHDYSTKESLDNFFTFSFVRNPWDRMVSHWKYFVETKRSPEMPFDEFVLDFHRVLKEADNGYWWNPYRKYVFTAPQLDFLVDENQRIAVDFVGRFETLQEDFDYVCKKLNRNKIKLPHKNKTKRKKYQEYYKNEELISSVAKRYKKDIDYFKYEFK
jgi:hypothetical protein